MWESCGRGELWGGVGAVWGTVGGTVGVAVGGGGQFKSSTLSAISCAPHKRYSVFCTNHFLTVF